MPLFFTLLIYLILFLALQQTSESLSGIKLFLTDSLIGPSINDIEGEINMFDRVSSPEQDASEASTAESETSNITDDSSAGDSADESVGDEQSEIDWDDISEVPYKEYVDRKTFEWPSYGSLYGYIDVKSMGVKGVKLYYGSTSYTRRRGISQSTDAFIPGYGKTVLLLGHCVTHFSFLEDIEVGTDVKVRTYYGTYIYRVSSIEIVKSTDKAKYNEIITKDDAETLVMYTCYPFTALWTDERYVVFCDKISGPEIR